MKNLLCIITILTTILSSCIQDVPDQKASQEFIEGYMNKINNSDYNNLSVYYSEEMNNGENDKSRIEKLIKLSNILGKVKTYSLIESKIITSNDEDPAITLIYKVNHTRMTVTESYTIKKEAGELKISGQNIENRIPNNSN